MKSAALAASLLFALHLSGNAADDFFSQDAGVRKRAIESALSSNDSEAAIREAAHSIMSNWGAERRSKVLIELIAFMDVALHVDPEVASKLNLSRATLKGWARKDDLALSNAAISLLARASFASGAYVSEVESEIFNLIKKGPAERVRVCLSLLAISPGLVDSSRREGFSSIIEGNPEVAAEYLQAACVVQVSDARTMTVAMEAINGQKVELQIAGIEYARRLGGLAEPLARHLSSALTEGRIADSLAINGVAALFATDKVGEFCQAFAKTVEALPADSARSAVYLLEGGAPVSPYKAREVLDALKRHPGLRDSDKEVLAKLYPK